MEYKEYELKVKLLNEKKEATEDLSEQKEIIREINLLSSKIKKNLTSWDRVCIARSQYRAKSIDYIKNLFSEFIELHGDRLYSDDGAIMSGLAMFHNIPVTVIAQVKGKTVEENIKSNFGMSHPEGYRKAIRVAKQAEKFNRPIITFVDTAGAYPGKGAEERGQAEAIANCLYEFSSLKTIVICVVIGEGGSGGALALSVADTIIMLENSVYSILSPEGYSSILWKDGSRYKEASEKMKLTSYDLLDQGIVDEIIPENIDGSKESFSKLIKNLDKHIYDKLIELKELSKDELISNRYKKYRSIGVV